MFHLIYTSRARQDFGAADLKQMLTHARSNNDSVNVTGMLIYHNEAFLQVLEGDEASVRKIFKRIEKDSRHARLVTLRSQKSFGERRIFGDWSMGFTNAPNDARVGQDQLTVSETQAMELLSSCSRIPRYQAA